MCNKNALDVEQTENARETEGAGGMGRNRHFVWHWRWRGGGVIKTASNQLHTQQPKQHNAEREKKDIAEIKTKMRARTTRRRRRWDVKGVRERWLTKSNTKRTLTRRRTRCDARNNGNGCTMSNNIRNKNRISMVENGDEKSNDHAKCVRVCTMYENAISVVMWRCFLPFRCVAICLSLCAFATLFYCYIWRVLYQNVGRVTREGKKVARRSQWMKNTHAESKKGRYIRRRIDRFQEVYCSKLRFTLTPCACRNFGPVCSSAHSFCYCWRALLTCHAFYFEFLYGSCSSLSWSVLLLLFLRLLLFSTTKQRNIHLHLNSHSIELEQSTSELVRYFTDLPLSTFAILYILISKCQIDGDDNGTANNDDERRDKDSDVVVLLHIFTSEKP